MSLMVFLWINLFTTFLFSPLNAENGANRTVYEVLRDYDFPVGLLPKGAVGYELEESSERFSAYLSGSCSFSLQGSYQLKYQPTIKGHISKGRIRNLEGVSVKVLFFWLNIVEVVRIEDVLDFSVGIASADFPLSNFEESPQCGCGLNCGFGQVRMIRKNPFVESS